MRVEREGGRGEDSIGRTQNRGVMVTFKRNLKNRKSMMAKQKNEF